MSSPLVVLERAVRLHLALTEADLPHALGGALALAYHVREARGTRLIDVNVTLDADHPEALFQALPADIGWSTGDVDRARRDGQVRGSPPSRQRYSDRRSRRRCRRSCSAAGSRVWETDRMLRWLTAGESHGPALMGVVEGLVAGVRITTTEVGDELGARGDDAVESVLGQEEVDGDGRRVRHGPE